MFIRAVFAILGVLAVTFGIGWAAEGNDFFMYKFFAPKQEQVRREVFEQSKSYNDGMAQEIMQMQIDYAKANAEQRAALSSVLLHRVAGYDRSKLPLDLQAWISKVEHDATEVRP